MNIIRISLALGLSVLLSASVAQALPDEHKPKLEEIKASITKLRQQISFDKKYDDESKKALDDLEAALKKLATDAGVDETDRDIKRELKNVARVREKLDKELAKIAEQSAAMAPFDIVFNKHKEDLETCSDTLKELQDAWGSLGGGYTEEKFETYIALTANIDKVLVLAETTLKAFEDGIPKSQMTKYMEYNSAAMKVGKYEKRLSSIVSTVKRLIPKTRENMGKVEETLKTRIDEDLEWIHQKDTQPSGAAVILGRVKQNLARLKELSGGKDAKYAKKALAKAKKGYKKAMKRVAKTRMPKDGSSDDALKETMSTLYAAKYKKDKVERVVIPNAKWREFAVIEITESGRLFRARYRAMNVHVAVTKGKKKPSKVYIIGFQKKYSRADGKWGALGLQSIGESYPILKKNIKK